MVVILTYDDRKHLSRLVTSVGKSKGLTQTRKGIADVLEISPQSYSNKLAGTSGKGFSLSDLRIIKRYLDGEDTGFLEKYFSDPDLFSRSRSSEAQRDDSSKGWDLMYSGIKIRIDAYWKGLENDREKRDFLGKLESALIKDEDS